MICKLNVDNYLKFLVGFFVFMFVLFEIVILFSYIMLFGFCCVKKGWWCSRLIFVIVKGWYVFKV